MDGKYKQTFQRSIKPTCEWKVKYCYLLQTNSNSVSWLDVTIFQAANSYSLYIFKQCTFLWEGLFSFSFYVFLILGPRNLKNQAFPSFMT